MYIRMEQLTEQEEKSLVACHSLKKGRPGFLGSKETFQAYFSPIPFPRFGGMRETEKETENSVVS